MHREKNMEKIRLSKIRDYTKEDVREYFEDLCLDCDFEEIWNDLLNHTRHNEFTSDIANRLRERLDEEWADLEVVKE